MSYKISVIVPVYNAEETLKETIESVINQSFGFNNIELLLYDDGSNDNSRSLINYYSKKYDNIIGIVSDDNSGYTGRPRNKCIEQSTTEYLMFLDSDDEYDKDMCKILYDEIISTDADIVSCSHLSFGKVGSDKAYHTYHGGVEKDGKIFFSNEDAIYFANTLVWSSIFKKKIILENNIIFPEDKPSDDLYFMWMCFLKVNKVIYIKEYFGVYKKDFEHSVTHKYNLDKLNEIQDFMEEIYVELKKYDLIYAYIYQLYIRDTFLMLITTNTIKCPKDEVISYLKRIKLFEEDMSFNLSLGKLMDIANFLILHNHFSLSINYLKFVQKVYDSDFLRSIYSKILKIIA